MERALRSNRIAALVLIPLAGLTVWAFAASADLTPIWPGDASHSAGDLWCDKQDGLPDAAAGKMWEIFDEPQVIEGHNYDAGDHVFIGYCDNEGKLIH